MSRDLVLDTNVVVHLLRRSPLGVALRAVYGLDVREWRPVLSAVTAGEMQSLAQQWRWDAARISQLHALLSAFPVVDVHYDNPRSVTPMPSSTSRRSERV